MKTEQNIATDFAITADIDKCISDGDYLEKCISEWVADIDREEIVNNLKMIQDVVTHVERVKQKTGTIPLRTSQP